MPQTLAHSAAWEHALRRIVVESNVSLLLPHVGIYYHLEDGPIGGRDAYANAADHMHRHDGDP